jgi:hypothetical protein
MTKMFFSMLKIPDGELIIQVGEFSRKDIFFRKSSKNFV